MLAFNELQVFVNEYLDLIEIDTNAVIEARNRAAIFLVVQARLANHLKELEDVKVKAATIEKASYAQAILQQSGKNVTENKIHAEADPEYATSRETIEYIDAEINWVKKHLDIFNNSHIQFRQISGQS